MKTIHNADAIEKYIHGELYGDELISFEKELETNKSFADDVKLHREIDKFLKNKDVFDLREMLDDIHEKVTSEEKNISKQKKKGIVRILFSHWQYAAASVLFLLAVSVVLFFTLRPSANERLYAQYFKPFDDTPIVRSDDQPAASKMELALIEYNGENFEKAWTMLRGISDGNKTDAKAYFYRGISAIEINNLNDAIASFKNVINNDSSLYIGEATWYLALCYLKENDEIAALAQFSKVAESNSNHKKEAEEIIEKLK